MNQRDDTHSMGQLRLFLFNAKEKYASMLAEKFTFIENLFYNKYLPLFSPDDGSQTGFQHIKNIEALLNMCLEKKPDLYLSPSEAFVLLSALILHDIGKIKERAIGKNVEEISSEIKAMRDKIKAAETTMASWIDSIINNNNNEYHHLFSALLILESPEKYGIFDYGLADCIARVCLLHDFDKKPVLERGGWLNTVYLDRYGSINIAWLGALLCLSDELDISYHRQAEIIKGGKGNQRGLVSGCEVDLVGRTLIIYPTPQLSKWLGGGPDENGCNKNKDKEEINNNLFHLYRDILTKESMLSVWAKELKQMGLELRSCAVLYQSNLITTGIFTPQKSKRSQELKNKERNGISKEDFMLSLESNITPMKVDRILEAILRLRFGVFGKRSFSWELLASESGMENIQEVKTIYHRIAAIAAIIPENKFKFEIPFSQQRNRKETSIDIASILSFDELETEWSIKVLNEDFEIKNVKAELCRRFSQMITSLREKYGSPPIRMEEDESNSGCYFLTRNKEFNYLLDEEMCRGEYGRGIFLPRYRSVEKASGPTEKLYSKRRMGINLVICGPPGIGKTTLATEFITSIENFQCDKVFKKRCASLDGTLSDCLSDSNLKGVVAYVSIEQPIATIESVIRKFDNADHILGNKLHLDIKNLQAEIKGRKSSSYDSYMGREYKDLYDKLTRGLLGKGLNSNKRVVLLSKLSPRFYSQMPLDDEKKVFWSRYKQLCRLCEHAAWYTEEWKDAVDQYGPPLLGVIIDSINAFGYHTLNREQIYQLFSLISWSGVLGVFICEESENGRRENAKFIDEVTFLSDIFIRLSWADTDYKYKQIEITKSRYQKHVLGPHPYKIRSNTIEVYPSLHTVMAREERNPNTPPTSSQNKEDILGLQDDSLILLEGARNTHKLALSMLYVYGCLSRKRKDNNVLVINFGPEIKGKLLRPKRNIKEIKNPNKKQQEKINKIWKKIRELQIYRKKSQKSQETQKYAIDTYSAKKNRNKMYVLTFNTGFLMPQECISKILNIVESEPIKRIVFFSTYHLPLRFPLLAEDPKFIPYLARILKLRRKSLLMISLDETSVIDEKAKQLISGLESTADCIIKASISDMKVKGYSKISLEARKIIDRDYNSYCYDLFFKTKTR